MQSVISNKITMEFVVCVAKFILNEGRGHRQNLCVATRFS